jgi:hypothetical protein
MKRGFWNDFGREQAADIGGLVVVTQVWFSQRRYFTRRPLKDPALVVFCLMLAVSPCSAEF